jgi:biopolymer transport protein ExbD
MMEAPGGKKSPQKLIKLNLTPMMDFLMVVIFYFLMVSNPHVFKELSSEVPILSEEEVKEQTPPLALTLKIDSKNISVFTGVPETLLKTFVKKEDGSFPLEELHNLVHGIKKNHLKDKQAILHPEPEVSYEEIVKIMDAIRLIRNTDESLYSQDQKIEELFSEIIFGNVQS